MRWIPRVAALAANRVEAADAEGELHHRRLTHDDRPGSAEAFNHGSVSVRNPLGKEQRATSCADTGSVDVVLDRDGHAMEQAEPTAVRFRRVDFPRAPASPSFVDCRERPKARIQGGDAIELRFDVDGRGRGAHYAVLGSTRSGEVARGALRLGPLAPTGWRGQALMARTSHGFRSTSWRYRPGG